jgi:site-specific recombinase XerD
MGYPRISLYVAEWPEQDQRLWHQAIRLGDPLEGRGVAGHWTLKTKIQVSKDYGRYLFWLQSRDQLHLDKSPADRVTKACLSDYLTHLKQSDTAPMSLLARIRNLEQAIHVMEPQADLSLLRMLISKLMARAEPRRRKEGRIVEPAVLIDCSFKAYDALLRQENEFTGRAATQARDVLMLAFFAFHPLRRASFATLKLGSNLTECGEAYLLHLDDDETKERRPYTVPLAIPLVPYLRHYLASVRPNLLKGRESNSLWISSRGTELDETAVYQQITTLTERLIGHAINPHLVRDCVMTSMANNRPESVLAGARLLGHNSLKTSERHYNQATTQAAHQQYVSALISLRNRNRQA